jgi:hypothetical protein
MIKARTVERKPGKQFLLTISGTFLIICSLCNKIIPGNGTVMPLLNPKSLLMVTYVSNNIYDAINLLLLLVINPDSIKFIADL